MKTVTIPEQEFLQLKSTVLELQKTMQAMQAQIQAFKSVLGEKYAKSPEKMQQNNEDTSKISWKRGSGKHIILYMADDFTAPLEDLKEYME